MSLTQKIKDAGKYVWNSRANLPRVYYDNKRTGHKTAIHAYLTGTAGLTPAEADTQSDQILKLWQRKTSAENILYGYLLGKGKAAADAKTYSKEAVKLSEKYTTLAKTGAIAATEGAAIGGTLYYGIPFVVEKIDNLYHSLIGTPSPSSVKEITDLDKILGADLKSGELVAEVEANGGHIVEHSTKIVDNNTLTNNLEWTASINGSGVPPGGHGDYASVKHIVKGQI